MLNNLPTVTYNYVTAGLNQIYASFAAGAGTLYSALSVIKSVLSGLRTSLFSGPSTSLLVGLPDEVALLVLAKLDTKSLVACLGSCTRMHDLYAGENEQTLLMQKKWELWGEEYNALLKKPELDGTQRKTLTEYFNTLLSSLFDPATNAAECKEVALLAEKAFRHLLQSDMKGPLLKILSQHPPGMLPVLFEKLAESNLHLAVHLFLLLDVLSESEKEDFLIRILHVDQAIARSFAADFREELDNRWNQPAWMVAVKSPHWRDILPQFLKSNPQSVNLLNFGGQNPVAFACVCYADIAAVIFLLKQGASFDMQDGTYRTAVDYAEKRKLFTTGAKRDEAEILLAILDFHRMAIRIGDTVYAYVLTHYSYPNSLHWYAIDKILAREYGIDIKACHEAYERRAMPLDD